MSLRGVFPDAHWGIWPSKGDSDRIRKPKLCKSGGFRPARGLRPRQRVVLKVQDGLLKQALRGFTLIELVIVIVIMVAIIAIGAVRWQSPDTLRSEALAQQLKEYLVRGPDRSKGSPFGVVLVIRNPANLPAPPNHQMLSFQEYADTTRTTLDSPFPTEVVYNSESDIAISSSFATIPSATTTVVFRTNGLVESPMQTTGGAPTGSFDILVNSVRLHKVVFSPASGSAVVQVCAAVGSGTPGAQEGGCPNKASGWCDSDNPQEDCLLP